MDDPLSAVDAHVGQHIMDNAMRSLTKEVRILATHQLQVLHHCDRILYMSEGRVVADGTFDHLMANSASFQRMMATVDNEGSNKNAKKTRTRTKSRRVKASKLL
jgi:ABC-type bacteriocin/lantibiotic exporter with double-glycine peptidase domain